MDPGQGLMAALVVVRYLLHLVLRGLLQAPPRVVASLLPLVWAAGLMHQALLLSPLLLLLMLPPPPGPRLQAEGPYLPSQTPGCQALHCALTARPSASHPVC
jgi:hypothetical protein